MVLTFFLGALLCSVLIALSVSPASAGKLVYIFDASGSMWGQVDGVAKIQIAKEALSELVRTIPEDAEVGLVVYGHRRKGDCSDIEELVPLKPLDKDALVAAVKGINPKGKTPMAASVQMVAEKLKASGGEAAIVLISDGKETCASDPCKLVRTLKQSGIKFTLHVIGFDVGGETEAQLRCMAEAGGGAYFSAKNAGDFGQAAKETLKKTAVNLKVSASRNGKPLPVDVFVTSVATGKVVANKASTPKDPAGFHLDPGQYDLRIVDAWGQEGAPEQTLKGIAVVKDQVKEVKVDFGGGALEVTAIRNGKPFAANVKIVDSKGKEIYKQTFEDKPARFESTPGVYTVTVKDEWGSGIVQELGQVEITSGTVKKEANFDTGTIEVWAYRKGKPYVADTFILDSTGKQIQNFSTREDQPAKAELLPGQYTLRMKDEWGDGTSVRETTITIQAGRTVEWKADFD